MKYTLPLQYFAPPSPRRSQTEMVLNHLKTKGTLSEDQARAIYGIRRLGARIYELKQKGYAVNSTLISKGSQHHAVYSI